MRNTTDPTTIYQSFRSREGSEFMATEFAISELMSLVRKQRPTRVLEVGAGIGTMTFALCSIQDEVPFDLITIEWNDFCISQLERNLSEQADLYTLVHSMDDVQDVPSFDLIVIDGGEQDGRFVSNLSQRGVVFIEGYMAKKHALIHDVHRGTRDYLWANFRSKDRASGIWRFQFEPTHVERLRFKIINLKARVRSGLKRRGWLGVS